MHWTSICEEGAGSIDEGCMLNSEIPYFRLGVTEQDLHNLPPWPHLLLLWRRSENVRRRIRMRIRKHK